MFCNFCGKQLRDGAKFCPECGKAVASAPTPVQQPDLFSPAWQPEIILDPKPAPVKKEAPAVVETPTPVVQEAPAVVETPAPVAEEAPAAIETPVPVVEEAPAVIETPAPVVEETPAVVETPAPVAEEAPAVVETPAPVVEEAPAVVETPAPVAEETPAVVETPAPVVEETQAFASNPVPVAVETPAPAIGIPASIPAVNGVPVEPVWQSPTDSTFTQPAPQNAVPTNAAPAAPNPAATVKKALSSPLFIIGILCVVFSVVASVLFMFGPELVESDDIDFSFVGLATKLGTVALILPTLLCLVGLIIQLIASFQKNGASTLGLGFIKSALWIKLVVAAVLIVALMVCSAFLSDAISDLKDTFTESASEMLAPMVGEDALEESDAEEIIEKMFECFEEDSVLICMILALIFVPGLLCSIASLIALSSMSYSLRRGAPASRGFGFAIAMNYISAGIGFIPLLSTLFLKTALDVYVVFNDAVTDLEIFEEVITYDFSALIWLFAASAAMLVAQILFAANLSALKRKINN